VGDSRLRGFLGPFHFTSDARSLCCALASWAFNGEFCSLAHEAWARRTVVASELGTLKNRAGVLNLHVRKRRAGPAAWKSNSGLQYLRGVGLA
jgi:hypothetical protein